MKFSKNVNNKKHATKMIFLNEKKIGKIRTIFDIENWLWKSGVGTFQPLDLERTLIYHKTAIYHSIKLPFYVEVAEKFLNGI